VVPQGPPGKGGVVTGDDTYWFNPVHFEVFLDKAPGVAHLAEN